MSNCKVKTITPVHVGSGTEYVRDTEFLYRDQLAGIIDDKKILKIIGAEHIGQWVVIIEKGEPLLDYLNKRKPGIHIKEVSSRSMDVYCSNMQHVKSLKGHIHTGTGKPYIPGSSIKGAIRTAVFSYLIGKMDAIPENIERNLYNRQNDKDLSKLLFGRDPNHDTFRFLIVGDAHFEPGSMLAMNVMSMNYKRNGVDMNRKVSQLTEAIGSGMEASCKISINKNQLTENLNRNVIQSDTSFLSDTNQLFKIINNHTKQLLNAEMENWIEYRSYDVVDGYISTLTDLLEIAEDCEAGETLLRLGHGSGWTFMTGNWAKDEQLVDGQLWDKIVDRARPGNNRKYQEYIFPKSRRMDEDGDLLGFVKLSLSK